MDSYFKFTVLSKYPELIHAVSGRKRRSFTLPEVPRPGYSFLVMGLFREREELVNRIFSRVDEMFRQGLVEEIRNLCAMGYAYEDPGMRGIGYAEFFDMMKGCGTLGETRELIKLHSRQYAKRQMTFFRKMPGVMWHSPGDTGAIRDRILGFLPGHGLDSRGFLWE